MSQMRMVTGRELHDIWKKPEAVGMTDDHQRGLRIVHLEDGSSFAATFVSVRECQMPRLGSSKRGDMPTGEATRAPDDH